MVLLCTAMNLSFTKCNLPIFDIGAEETGVEQVEVAVIGTGWCGGIRAETLSRSSIVDKLHICDIRPDRLAEVKALTNAASATSDYRDILGNDRVKVVYISTTPESNHYPIARDFLKAGKHVLLEKPIAIELFEADELIEIARRGNLKFTIGYSQRFNPCLLYTSDAADEEDSVDLGG